LARLLPDTNDVILVLFVAAEDDLDEASQTITSRGIEFKNIRLRLTTTPRSRLYFKKDYSI
jgi:hypothetical protein